MSEYLSADCCFSEHYKNLTKRVGLIQSEPHRHDIAEKLLNWRYTTITHSLLLR
jgi:hypothetical protein